MRGSKKRRALVWSISLGVPAAVAAGLFLLSGFVGDYAFSDTLPLVREEFGAEATVVSITDTGGDVTFELASEDGQVTVRSYRNFCERYFGRTSCSRRISTTSRASCQRELDGAVVTLGQLDQEVVDQLRTRSEAFKGATVALRGQTWVVQPEPFTTWMAEADGSGLRVAGSDADRERAAATILGAGARLPRFDAGGAAAPQPTATPASC